jgi:hypothetical protein
MKSLFFLIKVLIIMSTSPFSFAKSEPANKLELILQRPLIIGASVSGDYFTESPGKRLALRFTKPDQIKVIAKKGTSGKEVLKNVSASAIKDSTAIIGLDLFFWDSFAPAPEESLKALNRLVILANQQNIPLVLGEVPELMPGRQTSVSAINKKIHEVCKSTSRCKILPLNSILRKTLMDGYIIQDGKKYTLETLLPDGLHISKPASEFLADQIQKLL